VGKVVVVGSSNTDMTVRASRIPAPGETVLGSHFQTSAGGKGANQAVAASRSGAEVVLITALGIDGLGDTALENFVREGIDVDLVRRVPGVPSGVALIVVDGSGENAIAVAPGANLALTPDDVSALAGVLGPGDVVLLQLEIPLETVEAAARIAVSRGARVILNPAPAQALPEALIAAASMLTPNEAEAEQLCGVPVGDAAGLERAAAALHARGARDVLVTLGARGVFVSSASGNELVTGFRVEAIDTTAAGDVFNGALAAALVDGRSVRSAVRFASAAAAISVTRAGAQASAPSRDEIETFLRDR
jgi:ribokinase